MLSTSARSEPGGKPSLCIVAHFASGAMTGGHKGHVGGVERQTTLMARWFAARGYRVSILTWDEGVPDGSVVDGVRMFSICKMNSGLPGVRFFHPRTTGLWGAMARADADIYYHNCAEYFTGLIANWCRRHGRKFVYSSAHDHDCDAALPALPKIYERVLYRYGLRHADRVVVQTEVQKQMLHDGFGLDGIPLPMACPGPSDADFIAPNYPSAPVVAWAARLVWHKRPDWLLSIAEKLPHIRFEIAGANPRNDPFIATLTERASRLPNVTWLGPVPREQMPALYQRALCFCSTSISEGFPNTFLEAWSHGKPIVTTFDPDGLVKRLSLGISATTVDECAAAIQSLVDSRSTWQKMSLNARKHYSENYLPDASNGRFEQVFLDVLAAR